MELSDDEVREIQAMAERSSERRQAWLRNGHSDLPMVVVQTISPPLARSDEGLSKALAARTEAYRIVSMHWSDSGAVRVVWERR